MVYRPNEAKVRNLKSKDYLGKARLVAASDRANAFTGFAGSEIKNAGKPTVKDDRPAEKISFAATNLVKPELQSRTAAPPGGTFPPTPPPENERAGGSSSRGVSRGASVRNGPKPQLARLNIETPGSRYEKKSASPQDDRRAAQRSHSRTPQRGMSRRGRGGSDDGFEDLYDEYQGRSCSRRPAARDTQTSASGSLPPGFEIVEGRPGAGSNRGNLKIKVHAEDVRYIMVPYDIEFPDLVDRIRDKFGLRRRFKIKVRDDDSDGDMITMADQDDLDIAIDSTSGKMEVSFGPPPALVTSQVMTLPTTTHITTSGNHVFPPPAVQAIFTTWSSTCGPVAKPAMFPHEGYLAASPLSYAPLPSCPVVNDSPRTC